MVNTCSGSQKLRARNSLAAPDNVPTSTHMRRTTGCDAAVGSNAASYCCFRHRQKVKSSNTQKGDYQKKSKSQELEIWETKKQNNTLSHTKTKRTNWWCWSSGVIHMPALPNEPLFIASLYSVVADQGQLCIWVQLQAPWVHLTTERAQLICHLQTWHKWFSTFLFLSLPVVWRNT